MPRAGNIAKIMTTNWKQFTVTGKMLTAIAHDQRWTNVVAGILARFCPCCSLQAAMLSSAEFICLRVAYREAFWEGLSRLIWRGRSIRGPLLFSVHVIFFHSLPARVGCSFQGKLFSIFKLLCLVFVRYYLSSRTALENCVLFVIALRSSWENFFADTRFVLLTQAINLSRLS